MTRRTVLEILAVLACMLLAGTLWAALQDHELEARLRAANETARLYADSTALLRALCLPRGSYHVPDVRTERRASYRP